MAVVRNDGLKHSGCRLVDRESQMGIRSSHSGGLAMFSSQQLCVLSFVVIGAAMDNVALAQHSEKRLQRSPSSITVPKAWNDVGLSDWATPLALVNVRPSNFTEKELRKVPIYELYRSYPAYYPGREPAGYQQWLQSRKPELLIN